MKIIPYISTGVESKVPRPLVSFSSKQQNRKISSAAQWEEKLGIWGAIWGKIKREIKEREVLVQTLRLIL